MQRFISFSALFFFCFAVAHGATIYSTIPQPLPPNLPSWGYQATQTAEFGGLIQFGGVERGLNTVTVVMSDWALAADYQSADPTWNYPLTLNLYNADTSGPIAAVGSLIASQTQTFAIPWRPVADPTCSPATKWRAADGNCYNGLAVPVDFDFSGITVPDQIIYGLAFNTQTWGYAPTGTTGPYNSLNFALATTPPSAGSNPLPDSAFISTGSGGTFSYQTGWSPYSGAISFDATAVPEPASCTMLAFGLLGIVVSRIRLR